MLQFSKKMLVRYYTLLKEMKMNKAFIMEIAWNCAGVVVTTYIYRNKNNTRGQSIPADKGYTFP